jgi:mono/diheme cytochrome c family protein
MNGGHPMRPFAIDAHGHLYLDVPSPTNSCQKEDRVPNSPGVDPCIDLQTRGGVWRYDARKVGQVFSAANRYATGIRNAEGYGIDNSSGRVFVTQHGRDQLHTNWPGVIKDQDKEATLPSEELLLLEEHGDYGWPTCYYDPFLSKLVLAPEYGGDGSSQGRCADKLAPIAVFPAHWAPNDMVFYAATQFPRRYRKGIFIAFHGSWDRAPYAQGGYNIVFQGLDGMKAAGACEIFAAGFAGPNESPATAEHRPTGLAIGPDGTLYVADDAHGRIYRITYHAGANPDGQIVPCPSNTAPAGHIAVAAPAPEGKHSDRGRVLLPPGIDADLVALGDRIFHGESGATCTGCHGTSGTGSTLGPDLASGAWQWSDGSVAGIAATISKGVRDTKKYPSPMPPLGGAQLSERQVDAVAAYVWTLSHGRDK